MEPTITQEQVGQARSQAQSLGQQAVEFGAAGNTLADELRRAISERYNTSTEAQRGAEARAGFLAAAPQARSYIQDLINAGSILSPAQQSAILAAKRASSLVPVMAANTMDTAAFGNMQDLIQAGVGAYNAEAQRRAGLAQLAQQSYSDLLANFYRQIEEARLDKRFQFEKQYRELEEARMTKKFPLEQQLLQAQIKKTLADSVPGAGTIPSLQAIEIGGELYNFNPKTGEYTKANVKGGKSKYGEQDIVNFANSVADDSMKITAVPQEIRGSVQQIADQINASKPNPLGQAWNWFSGLFR